jgi:hypothetical protein
MKLPWWVWGIGLAGVGYVLYKFWHPVSTATSNLAQGIANIWLSLPLVGLGPQQTILGNARLPDGTLVPLNNLIGRLRQDSARNVYANISGTIYQLSPSDAQGNYPAALLGPAPAGG